VKTGLRAWLALIATAFGLLGAGGAEARDVFYPAEKGRSIEERLPFQVLKLALEKSGGDWQLKPSLKARMNETRSKALIAAGDGVDVGWYGTYKELEDTLLPVRIPINGGLLGWRLLLIDGARQSEFDAVRTLDDLKSFTFVQGDGWGDVAILKAAGLRVDTGDYDDLFRLIGGGRADAFPRSAVESFFERQERISQVPNLEVEQKLVIHYPFVRLFFVRKENLELHDAIYSGLVKAHADGSFKALFQSHPDNQVVLTKARLDTRRRIDIDNPSMSMETAGIPDKFWYSPEWFE